MKKAVVYLFPNMDELSMRAAAADIEACGYTQVNQIRFKNSILHRFS